MATYNSLSALFSAIADAIRAKKGTSSTISAQNFPSQIASIESANYATKSVTLDVQGMTLAFPDLKGDPKFFVAIFNQSSNETTSGTSYPRILAVYKTGTGTTKYALCIKYKSSGSAVAERNTGISYSYDSSTSTLTIVSTGTTNAGYFFPATYTLIYTY